MEVLALKILIPELKTHPEITGYVHDKDATAAKAIRDAKWELFQWIDPGHGQKSFKRTFDKFNDAHGKVLTEIEDSLLSFFKCLIRTDFSERTDEETDSDDISRQKAKEYWLNAVNHFCGRHAGCPFTHQPRGQGKAEGLEAGASPPLALYGPRHSSASLITLWNP
jgi:hypothetical protein